MENTKKQQLIEELETLKQELDYLNDDKTAYDEMLDEYTIKIGNLTFYGSRIVKELDPIAYDCGFSDFIDEAVSEKEKEIEEKQAEIDEIE